MKFTHVAVFLSLTLLDPSAALAANRFYFDAKSLSVCGGQQEVLVRCDNDVTLLGFSVGVDFDPLALSVLEVSRIGSVAEQADFFAGRIDASGGLIAYGCVFDLDGDFTNQALTPGTQHVLAKLIVVVTATSGSATTLSFADVVSDTPGGTSVKNIMTNQGGTSIKPSLETANLTIEERVPVITGFAGASGSGGTVFQVTGQHFSEPGLRVTVGGEEAPASLREDGLTLDVTAPTGCSAGPVEVKVCTDCGCDAEPQGFTYELAFPSSLTCRVDGAAVVIEWPTIEGADSIVLLRDDVALPRNDTQTETSYRDADAPCGPRVYRIEATICGVPDSDPPTCTIDAPCQPGSFVRGDADADGVINITDAVRILTWLFTGGAEPQCLDAADTDDLGTRINITDGVYLLDWLFRGGKSPPPPTPAAPRYTDSECGQDLTPDQLDCRTASPLCG